MTGAPKFELSIDTKLLYEELLRVEPGANITYKTLSDCLGRSVEGATSSLQSAIKRTLKRDGIVFSNIFGLGYRRLTDAEIVKDSFRDIAGMRRRARRAGDKLTKVQDFQSLTQQEQISHNARLSVFSAIAQMSKGKAVEKIEQAVSESKRELPFAETLAAFRK